MFVFYDHKIITIIYFLITFHGFYLLRKMFWVNMKSRIKLLSSYYGATQTSLDSFIVTSGRFWNAVRQTGLQRSKMIIINNINELSWTNWKTTKQQTTKFQKRIPGNFLKVFETLKSVSLKQFLTVSFLRDPWQILLLIWRIHPDIYSEVF